MSRGRRQPHWANAWLPVLVLMSCSVRAEEVPGPYDILIGADDCFYVGTHLKPQVQLYARTGALLKEVDLDEPPYSLALSPDGKAVLAAAGQGMGWLYRLDAASLQVLQRVRCGHSPIGICFNPDGRTMALAQRFRNEVWLLDSQSLQVQKRFPVLREPIDLAWRNTRELIVLHHISNRPATADWTGSSIGVLDIESGRLAEIPLLDGSGAARRMVLTPDQRYALAPMVISSHRVPATQLEQGWINKNGVTVVDLDSARMLGTLLLDQIGQGAPNPWDIKLAGGYAWISLAGLHQVMRFDYQAAIAAMQGMDDGGREELTYDLRRGQAWKKRIPLQGKGPRAMALSADGRRLVVASFFGNGVEQIDLDSLRVEPLIAPRPVAVERRGEFLFHDASICFQNWMSCASCHPDARTDAFNWDLENDGLGSPRQAKSMLFAHKTPPTTITGVRPNAEASVRAGIGFLQTVLPEEDASAIDTYLKNLAPVPSPRLTDHLDLSEKARAGRELFEGKAGCTSCHSGEYYTNQKLRSVGTGLGREAGARYDVPSLREVWRSAPYLNDGRAATIKQIFIEHNPKQMHGNAAQLTPEELDKLLEYVNSL